ncbi:T-cell surface glycoprotein CD1e, membrane-associated isoform X2 [Perognathus longimembris pacificus]|uniref:T-cell surface glycoprotein CD1e, membrane-associated isoform X2 n=1 Tax=Perognathus longimembris pacificus TaxID=214514 RepID=UPI00201917C5|nr:T-cell surface glycoprotein CD1e, membrane-associated isoform X2 [Perognathus longimembris pacificus]
MLFLFLLFFRGLVWNGESTAASQPMEWHYPAAAEPLSFRIAHTSSFVNHSLAYTQCSGWLGELQTYRWDQVSDTIRFVKPWSHGNFSKEQWQKLQALFLLFIHGFTLEVQNFASQFQFELKPEVWLSSGPSPGPGHLRLVCHVSGFHPKPVWVMWMRGNQEQAGTRQGDVLPNADETWYLRATLDVAAGQAAGLSCRVKHSSLGGHDIVIPWGGHSILITLLCLTVIVALVMVILHACWRKQSSNQSVHSPHMSNSAFPTETKAQDPRDPTHQLYLAQESWIKNRILAWKRSLNQCW